jgi:hypothetical protein
MTDEQTTAAGDKPGPSVQATDTPASGDAGALDLAKRLKAIVAELETGVATEPGDLLSPSEKLRAIADLIDRRAASAAPPTDT